MDQHLKTAARAALGALALVLLLNTPPERVDAAPCATMNVFAPATTANPALVNQNFANLVACAQNIDNSNIGSAGIYASQIIPTSPSQAIFGGTQSYTFPASLTVTSDLDVGGNVFAYANLIAANATVNGAAAVGGTLTAASLSSGNIAATIGNFSGSLSGNGLVTTSGEVAFNAGGTQFINLTTGLFNFTSPISTTAITTANVTSGATLALNSNSGIYGITLNNNSGGYISAFQFNGVTKATVGSNGAYVQVSDRRLKANIRPLTGGLRVIMALRPVTFAWKRNAQPDVGLIAQDVRSVLPQATAIVDGKRGYLGVSDHEIVAELIAAVQAQQREIAALKRELAAR
jgi:hypothetical protein